MAETQALRVVGLKELGQKLRAMEAGLQKEIPKAFKPVVASLADRSRSALPSRTGTLRGSVRPFATQKRFGLRVGSKRVPYAGPVEFGGWPPGRSFVRGGRFMFPLVEKERDRVGGEMAQALQALIRRVGL